MVQHFSRRKAIVIDHSFRPPLAGHRILGRHHDSRLGIAILLLSLLVQTLNILGTLTRVGSFDRTEVVPVANDLLARGTESILGIGRADGPDSTAGVAAKNSGEKPDE